MKRARPYNREEALDAALTLFWKKGYHATSLKDLEAALHMKPGSIYAAFSSKEALFGMVLKRYFERNRDAFLSIVESATSPLAGLAEFLRVVGRHETDDIQHRACMLVKTLLNATEEDSNIFEQAKDYLDQLESEMAAVFDRARLAGELPPETNINHLARRYQSDITALKIEAYRCLSEQELASSVAEKVRGIEQLGVSASIMSDPS